MELNDIVIQAILEKKGMHACDYDCRELTPFMDHVIVVSTNNVRQNRAIAQNIKDRVKEADIPADLRVEGTSRSNWLLIDLGSTVVHLFVKEERDIYSLDQLYGDCPVRVYDL